MDYLPYREPPADVRTSSAAMSCDVTGASLRGVVPTVHWGISSASVRRAPEPLIRSLQRVFIFRGNNEVERMTEANPQLARLLLEAHEQVRRVFGLDAPLVLEVVPNPETSDSLAELFLYIQTRLPVPTARERLRRLDEDWWLDALPLAGGRLNIALEYV